MPAGRQEGMACRAGEVTLTGRVLPIGGVKEKTLAARRSGVNTLLFPKGNQKDWDELAGKACCYAVVAVLQSHASVAVLQSHASVAVLQMMSRWHLLLCGCMNDWRLCLADLLLPYML